MGPSINIEPLYERVRGRLGEIKNDKDDGEKEGSRKRKFIIQTGLVLIFSVYSPLSLALTNRGGRR